MQFAKDKTSKNLVIKYNNYSKLKVKFILTLKYQII